VTHLRKMMLEELQRRNYAETTTRHYIRTPAFSSTRPSHLRASFLPKRRLLCYSAKLLRISTPHLPSIEFP